MPQELTESDIFVLLAKRHRRHLLRILRESDTPLLTIELANRVGERAYDSPSAKDRRAVYLALYHNHIPQLEEADVVAYDESEGTVQPGLNFDSVVRVLERADESDLPWSDE